mgnify:CR=1 FL=1
MSGSCPVSAHVCQETARERDELRAEAERLREQRSDEALVAELPKDKSPMPAMPGGGMGGMDF